jgi:hypothetical protein
VTGCNCGITTLLLLQEVASDCLEVLLLLLQRDAIMQDVPLACAVSTVHVAICN